jgi:hypothetical protein
MRHSEKHSTRLFRARQGWWKNVWWQNELPSVMNLREP